MIGIKHKIDIQNTPIDGNRTVPEETIHRRVNTSTNNDRSSIAYG